MPHYFSVESRIPAAQPLPPVKKLDDWVPSAILVELDGLYAEGASSSHSCAVLLGATSIGFSDFVLILSPCIFVKKPYLAIRGLIF